MNRLITILFLGITTITMQAKTDKEQIDPLPRNVQGNGGKGHGDTKPCPCR